MSSTGVHFFKKISFFKTIELNYLNYCRMSVLGRISLKPHTVVNLSRAAFSSANNGRRLKQSLKIANTYLVQFLMFVVPFSFSCMFLN